MRKELKKFLTPSNFRNMSNHHEFTMSFERTTFKPFSRHVEVSKNCKLKGQKLRVKNFEISQFVLRLFEFDLISAFGDEDDLYNPGNKGFSIKWIYWLKQIVKLELYISDIQVLDAPTETISKVLLHMRRLKTLIIYVGGQTLTNKGFIPLLRNLDQLKNLRSFSIDITQSKISKETILAIAKTLHYMPKISKIGLGIGDIPFENNEFIQLIKYGLRSLSDLKSFEISIEEKNLPPDSFIMFFSDIFSRWTNLEHLQLFISSRTLTDEVISFLSKKALSKMVKLREVEIDFGNNNLTDRSLESLTNDFLRYMTDITKLNIDMQSTQITDQGILSLVEKALSLMTNIREFGVAFPDTSLTNTSLGSLAWDCISKQKYLENLNLDFGYNYSITNSAMMSVKEALRKLEGLQMFRISVELTSVDSEGIRYLSEFISTSTQLKKLVINLNSLFLSDDTIAFLAKGIGNMTKLEYCVLSISEMYITSSSLTYLFKHGFSNTPLISFIKLIMSRTSIANKGIKSMLGYVRKMKMLERLMIDAVETKVTENYLNNWIKDEEKNKIVVRI